MIKYSIRKHIWWLIQGELAGMPMPYIEPARRTSTRQVPEAFDDDLALLHQLRFGSVVSLVKGSRDYKALFTALGFQYLWLPIEDGCPPSQKQVAQFFAFYTSNAHPMAVHCESGVGRTGTMLAAYLIRKGAAPKEAIQTVRQAQPAAIESAEQVAFLMRLRV